MQLHLKWQQSCVSTRVCKWTTKFQDQDRNKHC